MTTSVIIKTQYLQKNNTHKTKVVNMVIIVKVFIMIIIIVLVIFQVLLIVKVEKGNKFLK
jgi:uncharacterized membrane protein